MSQTVDFSKIKDQPVEKYDELAEDIDKLWRKANGLKEEEGYGSRRLSLAVTALEEALMWVDREYRFRGGKDSTNAS